MQEYNITVWNGEDLMPLVDEWAESCSVEDFAPQTAERDARRLSERGDGEIFVLKSPEGESVGFLGITILDMFYTEDFYSAIRYWYITPDHRAMAFKLIVKARRWSLEKGCTKMMACSNKLSVPCGMFLMSSQFTEYETVYVRDL